MTNADVQEMREFVNIDVSNYLAFALIGGSISCFK